MNELEFVQKLAERARVMPRPSVDVTGAVMRRVAFVARVEPVRPVWPLAVGLSLAVAGSFLLAVQSYSALTVPLMEIGNWTRVVFL